MLFSADGRSSASGDVSCPKHPALLTQPQEKGGSIVAKKTTNVLLRVRIVSNTHLHFQTHIYTFQTHIYTFQTHIYTFKHIFTLSNTYLHFQTHIYIYIPNMLYLQHDICGCMCRFKILGAWRRAGERRAVQDSTAASENENQIVVQTENCSRQNARQKGPRHTSRRSVGQSGYFHNEVHASETASFPKGSRFPRNFSEGSFYKHTFTFSNTHLHFQTHIYTFKHIFTLSNKHTFTLSNTHLHFKTHIYTFKHTFTFSNTYLHFQTHIYIF